MRLRVAAAVVFVLLVSGCAAPTAVPDADVGADRELGTIGEFTANDSLEIDADGELSRADLEALKYRSMARVEVIRGERFTEDVGFEIITRAEYRERTDRAAEPADPFTNELWRGAFVVDGETDVNEAFDELYGGAVQGYYSSGTIVIVTDGEGTRIDRNTLVHELVHALQDQHDRLEREGTTLDERRAETGLFEGEANYVPILYGDRCDEEWECLPAHSGENASGAELEAQPFNPGLFLSVYAPYAEGLAFVEHRHEAGDWAAVDEAFEERPRSTAELIHPERYPTEPVAVDVEDRSTADWEPFTVDDAGNEVRTETVGEATLFATLWANGAVDRPLTEGARGSSPYNYSYSATDGWAGDTFVGYHDEDNRSAHVWRLAWESNDDAEAFADAYRDVLEYRNATQVEADTYRIEGGPFAGAYRISVDGDVVELVGAPTVDDLEEVRPSESASTIAAVSASTPLAPDERGDAGGTAAAGGAIAAPVDG
ncbi:Hvo_1808 family surface protein [Natrononativus amylolyticus]|uniref:Hvo_1808 family surface protein n=1 Tax=Natrononativus amylolyticus TaxID=2963434 RepID=UPI0020CF073A|nr:Hvo_1808 family surface protein [Natrononativus amylolyticus]